MPKIIVNVQRATAKRSALLERRPALIKPIDSAQRQRKFGFAKFAIEANFEERVMAHINLEWPE